ncbi:hypothetical protein [Mycobacterium simiae]|uniref:hypothetical protein n=1 Tax=Mycobacterium simiae TaxID=1784 RepID=UPI00165FA302|nr:hypothetical protein [Mycobacterium simiae]
MTTTRGDQQMLTDFLLSLASNPAALEDAATVADRNALYQNLSEADKAAVQAADIY